MKTSCLRLACFVLASMAAACFSVAPLNAQTAAFTYQGQLTELHVPVNGTYDFQFELYDALAGGAQIGSTMELLRVDVTNGVFTVTLNGGEEFGRSAFSGADRFLQIAVRPGKDQPYTILSPRQQITASPYAIRTLSAGVADQLSSDCVGCVQDAQINAISASKITGVLSPTRGGTGLSSVSTGSLLYGSGTDTFSLLIRTSSGNVLLSGATPSWGKLDLASHVAGILPGTNGGTGANDVQFNKAGTTLRTFTVPDVSDTLAVLNTAQTWGAPQYFFQGLSMNVVARTGSYSMTTTDSVVLISPDAAGQYVELPCATTVGAGRIVAIKKMNTLYSIEVWPCGVERIDNAVGILLPQPYRGSVILISRGTSNGWAILASHALAED